MEDEVYIRENFTLNSHSSIQGSLSLFVVFDGHGGRAAAVFARENLPNFLYSSLEQGLEPSKALYQSFLQTDKAFIAQCKGTSNQSNSEDKERETMSVSATNTNTTSQSSTSSSSISQSQKQSAESISSTPTIQVSQSLEKDTSGTTAVAVLVSHALHTLWVAHVGDSRAILIKQDGTVMSLTQDHKADRADEVERIRAAGGFVVHKRVMGELAISRAIGDVDFKEKGFAFVLAEPDVNEHRLTPEHRALVLACDGLFDVMTNQDVATYVTSGLQSASAQAVAEKIVRHSIDKLNTRDNVTVVTVTLDFQPSQLE